MCIWIRFTCADECVALPNKSNRPKVNRTVVFFISYAPEFQITMAMQPRSFETRPRKTDTLRPGELDQECEMLDVPGIGIIRMKSLQTRSEHDLRTESGSSYCNDGIRVH